MERPEKQLSAKDLAAELSRKVVKKKSAKKALKEQPKDKKLWYVYPALVFAALIMIAAYYFFSGAGSKPVEQSEKPKEISPYKLEQRDASGKLPGQIDPPTNVAATANHPFIKGVEFIPAQPARTDSIRVGVVSSYSGTGKITYEYQWRINGKSVADVKGDILPSGRFKKGDLIEVSVLPSADGVAGNQYNSRGVLISSAPPTLELKETISKPDNTTEFQLVSIDPDNDSLKFSLEDPLEGMTIDKETGKVLWKPAIRKEGKFRFRASVADSDGNKVSKTFEFEVRKK